MSTPGILEFNDVTNMGQAITGVPSSPNVWDAINLSSNSVTFPNATLQVNIYLGMATSLVGYGGGALCDYVFMIDVGSSGNCRADGTFATDYETEGDPLLTSGSLATPSGTPEPASWLLLLAAPAVLMASRRFSSKAGR